MDYYSSNFYQDHSGEYFRTSSPYYIASNYDVVPFEDDSVSDSTYEFSQDLHFSGYDSSYYGGAFGPFLTPPQVNYYNSIPYDSSLIPSHVNHSNFIGTEPKFIEYNTISNSGDSSYDYPFVAIQPDIDVITKPKLLQYDPIPYSTGYFSPDTRFLISYSTSAAAPPEVDDDDDTVFAEYDPTPYGGGYDPTLAYGESLPPSEEICHPRSFPVSNGLPSGNFSFGSIPSPYGKDDIAPKLEKTPNKTEEQQKPSDRAEPIKATEEQQKLSGSNGDGDGKEPEKAVESSRGEEREGWCSCDGHRHPWRGYEDGDYGCRSYAGYGNPVVQTPYGYYGSEGMELFESLFGYWPCLSRQYRRRDWGLPTAAAACEEENQWKSAADYLFGSPNTDGGGVEGNNYGGPLLTYNNYERHYQEEQLYTRVEDENSWLPNFKTF